MKWWKVRRMMDKVLEWSRAYNTTLEVRKVKQTTVTIKYDEEKLNAIKQYMAKKDADLEEELADVLLKLYEKYVPQAVREYIESRGDVPAAIKKVNKNTVRNTENSDQSE